MTAGRGSELLKHPAENTFYDPKVAYLQTAYFITVEVIIENLVHQFQIELHEALHIDHPCETISIEWFLLNFP